MPVQTGIALLMFTSAGKIHDLIDLGQTLWSFCQYYTSIVAKFYFFYLDIIRLTSVFVVFIGLAATQDIAIDGLAISILSRWNLNFSFVN